MLSIEIALWLTQRQSWCVLFSCISCLSSFLTTHSGTMGEWEGDGSISRGYSKQGETSYSVWTPHGQGLAQKMNKWPYEGRKQKVVSITICCKGRTTGWGVLSFLLLCIPPFLSPCMQGCVCTPMAMCTKAITPRMSQDTPSVSSPGPATLQCRLAAPNGD